MQPGEMNIDPIESEFFSTEALGSLADALVREAIQNSLDARSPGEPVRVRIAFSPPGAWLQGERAARYFAGLWRHLAADRSGLARLPSPEEPVGFLVVEDYGTRGLQGDPRQSEDEESAPAARATISTISGAMWAARASSGRSWAAGGSARPFFRQLHGSTAFSLSRSAATTDAGCSWASRC